MKASMLIGILLPFILLSSCGSGKKEVSAGTDKTTSDLAGIPASVPVDYSTLSGYFLNNSYELKSDVNIILAVDPDQMSLAFGMAKTMNNTVDKVDFGTEAVVGIALQPTDLATEMKIDKMEKVGNTLNVYLTITRGDKQTFTTKPLTLFSLPKNTGVDQVELYIEGEKKASGRLS